MRQRWIPGSRLDVRCWKLEVGCGFIAQRHFPFRVLVQCLDASPLNAVPFLGGVWGGFPVQDWMFEVRSRVYSRSSLPVSCEKTSFKLGRFKVTFSTRRGSSSKSRRHSEGCRLF